MTREEPSLETLWLKNTGTMYEVQKIYRSNKTPSSKTFRDETSLCSFCMLFTEITIFQGHHQGYHMKTGTSCVKEWVLL
jgi:hypothetical protein